jgi:serine/threonine-protein kinase PpkA
MFHEMLTGRRPFRGSSIVAIIHAHRSEPIPTLPDELKHFQGLIDGLLAKNPQDRFPTAAAALAELAKMKV